MTTILDFENVFKEINYPSGEWHLQAVDPLPHHRSVIVAKNVRDFNGLMKCQVGYTILESNWRSVNWVIPFFPFARDDRRNSVLDGTELLFATQIAANVGAAVVDPHSDVTTLNLRYYPQSEVVREFYANGLFNGDPVVAIPDAGAAKKAYTWISEYGLDHVQCVKRRDPATGKLSGFQVIGNGTPLAGRDIIIVDDICDGGGTFNGLAEELLKYRPNNLRLAVTHGLFTKGMEELTANFQQIYALDHIKPLRGRVTYCSLNNIIERGKLI